MQPTRGSIDRIPLAAKPVGRRPGRTAVPVEASSADAVATRDAQSGERSLAAIVESAADGIATVALDGIVLTWNPAAARILGIAERDVLGTSVADLVAPGRRPGARRVLDRATSGRRIGPVHVVVPDRGAGREMRDLSVVLAPVRGPGGQPEAIAVIARDITDVRRLRRARARLRAELAQTRRVASLGRLVQSVAHDLNNILAAIHGFATIAAADLTGRGLEEQLEIIRAAERGSDLARRLLVQTRQLPAVPVMVAIDDVLGSCARMLRRLLPAGVELALRLEADAMVAIDPVEVDQILMNLVLNARDAIGDAGLIVVKSRRSAADVLLTVSDTGPGMDAVTRDRAFEPYFTTKGPGDGTGLGLATVREIVDRAGGSIDLLTAPGGGTTLSVHLPAAV